MPIRATLKPTSSCQAATISFLRSLHVPSAFAPSSPSSPPVAARPIDYLFNKWKGKPAMVVTYGSHGGNKCAAAPKTVLGRMSVV